jgi:hypothetical protein
MGSAPTVLNSVIQQLDSIFDGKCANSFELIIQQLDSIFDGKCANSFETRCVLNASDADGLLATQVNVKHKKLSRSSVSLPLHSLYNNQ